MTLVSLRILIQAYQIQILNEVSQYTHRPLVQSFMELSWILYYVRVM